MKHFTNLLAAPCLIVLCALPSCNKPANPAAQDARTYSETSGAKFMADEFSPWMSKADQQIAYENREAGTHFAYTEGRCEGGFQQYRHVVKPLPEDTQWGVYWGLGPNEFFQMDLKLQRDGFTRSHLQVFEDGTGAAFHQAVWMKKE